MEKKIYIKVRDGLITNISTSMDLEDVLITIIDYDNEGSDIEELTLLPDGEPAYTYTEAPTIIDDDDMLWYEELEEIMENETWR